MYIIFMGEAAAIRKLLSEEADWQYEYSNPRDSHPNATTFCAWPGPVNAEHERLNGTTEIFLVQEFRMNFKPKEESSRTTG